MTTATTTACLVLAGVLALAACEAATPAEPEPVLPARQLVTSAEPDMAAEPDVAVAEPAGDASEPLKQIEIDLDAAIDIDIPDIPKHLEPVAFETPDGRDGWVVRIPGNLPIATPAYADGLLFVGGGYGSHEFYAFHADTGRVAWQIKTGDDGPTAAVVEDGLVAFNTESCTVIVCEAATGKVVWQEWLGDPLMSQPAIHEGRLYIAYPAGQRGGTRNLADVPAESPKLKGTHRLLCADLRTGKHIWKQGITGDVISAPVIDDDRVYFTCFDGTAFCLETDGGGVVWQKKAAATSAPLVAAGRVITTLKRGTGAAAREGITRMSTADGDAMDDVLIAEGSGEHLESGAGGGLAMDVTAQQHLDAGVGFGTAPSAAGLSEADRNVGVRTVAGGWAFQGARAAYSRGMMLNAQGGGLNCVFACDNGRRRFLWKANVLGGGLPDGVQAFAPPSLGDRNMYLAGARGHIASVRQEDGHVEFLYDTKRPMVFQPALAGGNVYVGTLDGLLICVRTGDRDADGWSMWGGNAQHNKSR